MKRGDQGYSAGRLTNQVVGAAEVIVASGTGAEAWDPKLNPDILGASPFRGLSPLQESDTEVFFGRDNEVEQVIAALSDRSPVVLCGPSGCGKSSLALGRVPGSDHCWVKSLRRSGSGR
ncbi:nSTAND1 domain-containing NTPase [Streptomyces sp. NPDC005071]